MDTASEDTPPVERCRSPQSQGEPVTPSPPVAPLQAPSSPPVSQLLQPANALPSEAAQHVASRPNVCQPPSRSLSNIGRKRALASPLARPAATPGHVSQMQRIFQDAKASLQLDAAIINPHAGSVASGLPGTYCVGEVRSPCHTVKTDVTECKDTTAQRGLAGADLDAREKFSTNSPRLPGHDLTQCRCLQPSPKEPISSGFTSPVVSGAGDVVVGGDSHLLPLPDTGSPKGGRSTASFLPRSDRCQVSMSNIASTELDQPMTRVHVSQPDVCPTIAQQDSPSARRGRRRCFNTLKVYDRDAHNIVGNRVDDSDGRRDIMLSTPAGAAAESANAKRGLLWRGVGTFSSTDSSRPESGNFNNALPLFVPRIHFPGVPGVQIACQTEEESVQRTNAVANLQQQQDHYSPAPHQRAAPPSQQPRSLLANRQQNLNTYPSKQNHRVTPSLQHHSLLEPARIYDRFLRPSPSYQQPVHIQSPPLSPVAENTRCARAPDPQKSHFHTITTSHFRSSPTPESHIRDAYCRGAPSPIRAPALEFRRSDLDTAAYFEAEELFDGASDVSDHAVIGADPQKQVCGVQRLVHHKHHRRIGLSRAITNAARKHYAYTQVQARAAGPESLEEVIFKSSPPRSSRHFRAAPRRKKARRSRSLGGEEGVSFSMQKEGKFGVAHDCDVMQGVSGKKTDKISKIYSQATASVEKPVKSQNSRNGNSVGMAPIRAVHENEKMLFSIDSTAAITKRKITTSSAANQKMGMMEERWKGVGEEIRELSPYVTAYRKGRRPEVSDEERRPSYWDGDILPLRTQGAGRENLKAGEGEGRWEYNKENVPPDDGVNEDGSEDEGGGDNRSTDTEMVDATIEEGSSALPAASAVPDEVADIVSSTY